MRNRKVEIRSGLRVWRIRTLGQGLSYIRCIFGSRLRRLRILSDDIVVAYTNSPQNVTLSGKIELIEALHRLLK